MGACVTEEQAITHAQYLDLVYSQSGMLYDVLLDTPGPGASKAPSMMSLLLLLHLLKSLPRLMRNKNLLLLVKMLLRSHLILAKPLKLMPFSPSQQIKLRKVRRREKVKIRLIH